MYFISTNNHKFEKHVLTPQSFQDDFDEDKVIQETGDLIERKDPNWWLSSGAYFYINAGIGHTVYSKLPALDPWRLDYSVSNWLDTDGGYYPQNIFRFVSTSRKWKDYRQQAYFKIVKYNLSLSPNRRDSNGLLLFNRYQDAYNLYYTGIRVDGSAVIKKKIKGEYYDLAREQIFNMSEKYDRNKNPNLLPLNEWIGLRSVVRTNNDGTVTIELYMDKQRTGDWILIAKATDDGMNYGGKVISDSGYTGIRTDFMDVEFDDYIIENL
jgi:hypothetical protein